jgi:hypothetical protein
LEKGWLCTANCCSVWVHQTVSDAPGWALANWPLLGIRRRCMAIIHRTVRWCTGLSGEPTAASATVGRAICARRVAPANGRLGAPDYPVCTGQCPVCQPARRSNGRLRQEWKEICTGHATVAIRWRTGPKIQRSAAPGMEGDPHQTCYSGCPVVHRTVRCATRQKARIAFLVRFQRLLAALGL